MRAMILAAGLGTRLRPLTYALPKPALPVGNQPLLTYNLAMLKRVGVTEVVINLHWLPEALPRLLGDGSALGMALTWSYEPEVLGTGGGIHKVADFLGASGEPFFVLNGDLLIDFDLQRVLEVHRKSGAEATMVLREDPNMQKYGSLGVDEADRIVDFVGRARAPGEIVRRGLFTGIHVMEPSVLACLPDGESCVNQTAYPQLVREGRRVQACFQTGFWSDVGTPDRYLEANLAVLSGQVRGFEPVAPESAQLAGAHTQAHMHAHTGAGGGALWGRAVQIDPSSQLDRVVVGDGARVEADVQLSRSVVWAGAQVTAGTRLTDAIVWTRDGQTEILSIPA